MLQSWLANRDVPVSAWSPFVPPLSLSVSFSRFLVQLGSPGYLVPFSLHGVVHTVLSLSVKREDGSAGLLWRSLLLAVSWARGLVVCGLGFRGLGLRGPGRSCCGGGGPGGPCGRGCLGRRHGRHDALSLFEDLCPTPSRKSPSTPKPGMSEAGQPSSGYLWLGYPTTL